ncbi:hypothetical protein BJY01DRAFT_248090 [Aspergillus pseudoustus]|uniref:Uncharacterized protein n=1 Tax=Aspergillus pseudoustus TaxID=1810923 RepID=A0ABR4JX17_9EURO
MEAISTNNTLCSFSSPNELFRQTQDGHVNLTAVLLSCENLCAIAYGTGNSDVAGIGVMISYTILSMVTTILNLVRHPIFPNALLDKNHPSLNDLHYSVLELSASTAIPFGIASGIRTLQHPAMFEGVIMTCLWVCLVFLLCASLISLWEVQRKEAEEDAVSPVVNRRVILHVHSFIIFAIIIALSAVGISQRNYTDFTRRIATGCEDFHAILPSTGPVVAVHWLNIGAICVLFLIYVVLRGCRPIPQIIPKLLALYALLSPLGACAVIGYLWSVWADMRRFVGSDFDDSWGFGQTMALFIWVPWFVRALSVTWP